MFSTLALIVVISSCGSTAYRTLYKQYRPIYSSSCRDIVANCRTLAKHSWCYNYNFKSYMLTNCKRTCGWCKRSCVDRNVYCGSWARQGYCTKNWQYMYTNCPRSCGKCTKVTVVNGKWSSWSIFSKCSASCGGGIQVRYRQCNNPKPKNNGRSCSGQPKETRRCNTQECKHAVDGGWGAWGPYTSCSKSCGEGYKSKTRRCNNPPPQHGGKRCSGRSRYTTGCFIEACKKIVDGQWGSWSDMSCSVTCGVGVQTRLRRCDSPPPENGGKDCVGKSREQSQCSKRPCPKVTDGKWSTWGRWSSCTKSCNGGFQTRYRDCNNPSPSSGGRYCQGSDIERIACNTQRCKAKRALPQFNCGRGVSSRIVGGSLGKTTDWPWQAGLKRGNEDTIFCGGSLINREWVLTAAHCIYRLEPSRTGCVAPEPRLRVIFGEFDVDNVEGHEVTIDIAQVCMHPKYDHMTLDYDIALLRLATPIMKFTDHMKPVCLPTPSYVLPFGDQCTVTGFGKLGETADLANQLQQATIPVKKLDYCKKQYPRKLVSDRMICAGYEGGKIDSCKGDSGGPFVCKDRHNYVLAGAVSWGVGCARAGQPGLYVNIRYFLPWIKTTIQNT